MIHINILEKQQKSAEVKTKVGEKTCRYVHLKEKKRVLCLQYYVNYHWRQEKRLEN